MRVRVLFLTPMSLVAIEGAVGAKLVGEDPLAGDDVRATRPENKFPGLVAHEGPVLIFHCRTLIRIGERGTDRGRDRRRRRGGEGERLCSHPKAVLSPRDHPVRVYGRREGQHRGLTVGRPSGQRRRCQRWCRLRSRRSCWRGAPSVDRRGGRPLTRWRPPVDRAGRGRGRRSRVRRGSQSRGHARRGGGVRETALGWNPGGTAGAGRGVTRGTKPRGTTGAGRQAAAVVVPVVVRGS
jgi:hypothetical protein